MEGREERPGQRAAHRQRAEGQRQDSWAASSPGPLSADFLTNGLEEGGVTGEVMNLDDFLKELNEPGPPTPAAPARLSVFQSVGRAPVLRYSAQGPASPPPASPSPPEEQKPSIPQASVRPQQRARAAPGTGGRKRKAASATAVREGPVVKQETKDEQEEEQLTDEEGEDDGRQGKEGFTSTVMVNFSADDLRLATIPGQEGDFDPATRRFSEDELKPQPIIRKRRKQFVPDELKNGKYWAKRNINNEAAKRSREARRLKENQIAMRARFLEEENNVLKVEVDELKKENGEMRVRMLALEQRIAEVAASRR